MPEPDSSSAHLSPADFAAAAKQFAAEAGFDLCGITAAQQAPPELDYFSEWLEAGHGGEMQYLAARNEAGELKRASLAHAAPWARSVIVCALNYNAPAPYSVESSDPARAWISRYAWFANEKNGRPTDYHDAVLSRLRAVEARLAELYQSSAQANSAPLRTWCYVDTGPVVERVYAKYAGIGWIAKNTCILNQEKGSWLFLGVILTSFDLSGNALDLPAADRCGSCTRCLEACPTGALTAPYQMDATRCIAYLTIEKRGAIPEEFRAAIGNNVFGCDICQDVCPWNGAPDIKAKGVARDTSRRPAASPLPEFQARPELVAPPLAHLASLTRDDFNQMFRHSPIKRAKYSGFMRNVAIAMGNSGDASLLTRLEQLAASDDELIREHALWAIAHLKGEHAQTPRAEKKPHAPSTPCTPNAPTADAPSEKY